MGRLTENGAVPRRLTPVFRDRGELAAADDLGEEIEEALAGSRFMIVLCSPAAVASRWTNAEIAAFKRLRPDGCIFAAIIAGEPFASDIPGREAEECFPPALLEKYDRRGRPTGKRAEPIAADLRTEGDGQQLGLMKIIAGMLGVGLDDLVQREGQRRQRRMQLIAAASLLGMIFTTGMSLMAIQSRDAAREQRREAEGLVAFMVGDLRDKLEPIGKLDTLEGVGARVLAYYSKQDVSELSDAGLLQRASALNLTASVAYQRLDFEEASRLYREAMAGTGEAVARAPDDPQRLFDHAQNVFWIGEIARQRGESRRAEAAYREYGRLADRMSEIEPDNLKWRMEVLYAKENIGIVLLDQRRFAEATRLFEEAILPMGSGVSVDTGNAAYEKEYSTLLAWLADGYAAQGMFDRAIETREKQLSFLRRRVSGEQSNVVFRLHLIPAHLGLANLFLSKGLIDRGIEQLNLSVAESERLLPIEPDNAFWIGFAARSRLHFAKTLLTVGRTADATVQAQIGCDQARRVRARNPGSVESGLQTDCFSVRAHLAMANGDLASAMRLAEQALASARTERSTDSIKDRYRIAAGQRLVGDVRRRAGDPLGARTAWSAGLAELPSNVTERPVEMNEHAELLRRLDRTREARPLIERLRTMGYQTES